MMLFCTSFEIHCGGPTTTTTPLGFTLQVSPQRIICLHHRSKITKIVIADQILRNMSAQLYFSYRFHIDFTVRNYHLPNGFMFLVLFTLFSTAKTYNMLYSTFFTQANLFRLLFPSV